MIFSFELDNYFPDLGIEQDDELIVFSLIYNYDYS